MIYNPVTAASIGAVPTSRQVIAGTNMTGGGTLAADRTLNATRPSFPRASGSFISLMGLINMAAATNAANGTPQFFPFILTTPVTLSDLGMRVGTLSGGGNIQVAIYASDAVTGLPTGSELAKTGNLSTTSAVVVTGDIVGLNVTLLTGCYWAAWNSDNATCRICAPGVATNSMAAWVGSPTAGDLMATSAILSLYLTTPLAFNTWGDLSAAVFTRVSGVTGGVNLLGKIA